MNISNIITLISGIALFLFGMSFMGDGLKRVAGNKLEVILYKLSGTPLKSVLLGTGVTAVIQSSSATSVMTVGFVNSGMMKLKQAIGVILGSVLGTSITGWVVCLSMISGGNGWTQIISTDTLTCIIAIIGVSMIIFSKKTMYSNIGMIMMGFSVLMIGIDLMTGAVAPLKDSDVFINIIVNLSNPLLGMLAGIVMTSVLQSASAAVGILQTLSVTGAFSFYSAFPLILGISIGSSVPVILSAIGAKINGKRAAFTYLYVNCIGAVLFGIIFYLLDSFLDFSFVNQNMTAVSISMLNTVYRLGIVLILSPVISFIEKLTVKMFREKEGEVEDLSTIDNLQDRLIAYPAVAIEQSRNAINAMATKAQKNLIRSFDLLSNYKSSDFDIIQEKETVIDKYEDKLGTFLVKINAKELNRTQNKEISKFLHALSDFERIGDHAVNLSETAKEIYEKKIVFSEKANSDLEIIQKAILEIVDMTVRAFIDENIDLALSVEPLEECIDNLCDQIKLNHIMRVQKTECKLIYGYVFNDILTSYERIADHCSNIAVAMIELESDELNSHRYLDDLKNKNTSRFKDSLEVYTEKYKI